MRWIYFIANIESLDFIPNDLDNEEFRDVFQYAKKHGWTKAELIAYDNASIAIQDARGRIKQAVDKAIEETVDKKNREVIERCWQKNMITEMIAEITGVSAEEIQKVVDKIK